VTWNVEKLKSRGYAFYESGAMAYNLWLGEKMAGVESNPYAIDESDYARLRSYFHLDENEAPLLFIELKNKSVEKTKVTLYKDGTYTGEWKEWPEMKVEVTILRGKIAQIRVLEDFGTPEFSAKAKETLPGLMVKKGSTDVESITGATLSSNSLKKAVNAALEKAR
jgi:uncharacterized protein with FMN-binding domain